MRSGADCVPGRMLIIGRRNMNIEYRRAAAADAETLVAIYNAAFYSDSVKYGDARGMENRRKKWRDPSSAIPNI